MSPSRVTHLSAADAARLAALRRMRLVALLLLVVAAIVYVATRHLGGFWGYVNAGAEASMVGGMADWFAVTALFRHPLGLKIPHTAIIPTRKDQLATGMEEFFAGNFLTPSAVREKVDGADVAGRLGAWLHDEQHAARVVSELVPAMTSVLRRIKDEDITALVEHTLVPRLQAEELSPAAGALLAGVVRDRAHQGVVDVVADEAARWLAVNRTAVARLLQTRTPWWSPRWVDDIVTDRLHLELVTYAAAVRDDPEHPMRRAVDNYLAQLADDLVDDADTRAKAEALKDRLLTNAAVAPALVGIFDSLRRETMAALADPEAPVRQRLNRAMYELGHRLVTDDDLRDRVNQGVGDAVATSVERYGPELSSVISTTIERWDGAEAAEKIELHAGRDLQFIRINGTVVGGLVGVLIHAFTQIAAR